jgi:hypothetical protein
MKIYFSILLTLPFFAFPQHTITILDSFNQSPIGHVAIYNEQHELIGMSNDLGTFSEPLILPLILNCYRYQSQIINELRDTLYMIPQHKKTQEVVVGPFDLANFYQKLISNSRANAASDPTLNIYGTYIESILIIDVMHKDSIYLGKIANLTLVKTSDNKNTYEFFPINGKKTFWSTDIHSKKDTSKYEKWADIIPRFSTLLAMDLSNPKEYQINFKNYPLIERNSSSLLCGNKTGSISQNYQITFNNNLMESWKKVTITVCDSTKASNMCFASITKVVEFHSDEIQYHLSNGLLEGEINLRMNGEGYIIKLVKGFVEQNGISHKLNSSCESMESYFKSIPHTIAPGMKTFYVF